MTCFALTFKCMLVVVTSNTPEVTGNSACVTRRPVMSYTLLCYGLQVTCG